jgi:hypothetical protein
MNGHSCIPPGPWCESVHPESAIATDIISEVTGDDVCTVWFPPESEVSNLIAAAPSLAIAAEAALVLLEHLASLHPAIAETVRDEIEQLRAALGEAEGQA